MTATYFANLHDEAFALLVEARNYIQSLQSRKLGAAGGNSAADYASYLDLSLETMRLTSRLTQVMAWMLAQRAVSAGEITAREGASKRFRLSGQSVCLEHDPANNSHIPEQLFELLKRSHELYLRVSRLEAQISGRLGTKQIVQTDYLEDAAANVLPLVPVTTSGLDPQNAY